MAGSLFDFASIIYVSVTVLLWVSIIAVARYAFRRSNCEARISELRMQLREERKRVKDELRDCRRHYETLLKEAGLRNVMALALWQAYKSGELTRCYDKGGRVRVLADGSVICWRDKPEQSYTITLEEEKEDAIPEYEVFEKGEDSATD